MPGRYLNPQAPQSGLDALVSGFGDAYAGVRDDRQKRETQALQNARIRQEMQNAELEQQRQNIQAGITVQQGTRPDPIQQGQAQATGVRAKIGSILRGVFGGGQSPELQPTPTLVKTGKSQAEILTGMQEEGANSRNAATIAGEDRRSTAGIASMDTRAANELAETTRWHDLEHADRLAALGFQRDRDARNDRREDNRDLRDYGRQLNEEIASLQRMAADRNGIMQQVGGEGDPVAAYQQRQREIRARIGELHQQLNDVNAQMSRKAIGQKLGAPPKAATPAGVPSRARTPEEDMLLKAMPPGSL